MRNIEFGNKSLWEESIFLALGQLLLNFLNLIAYTVVKRERKLLSF